MRRGDAGQERMGRRTGRVENGKEKETEELAIDLSIGRENKTIDHKLTG